MAVYSTLAKAGPFVGDGVQRVFPFEFAFIEPYHVAVYADDKRVSPAAYEVTRPEGYLPGISTLDGGNIVFKEAPARGSRIAVIRDVPVTQETDIQDNTAFYPEAIERGLDKLTMICQQLMEESSRGVHVSPTSGTSPEALSSVLNGVLTGFSIDSTGRLFWKNCEVLTRCNTGDIGGGGGSDNEDGSGGSDGEDGSGGSDGSDGEDGEDGKDGRPGEIIVVGEGDTSKGYVRETGYERTLDFQMIPNASDYHGDEECKADCYYCRILVHEKYPYAFSAWHEKMATVQGESWEEEDENGEPVYYCELPPGPYYNEDTDKIEIYDSETEETREIQIDVAKVIAEVEKSIKGIIDGKIHCETASPEAVAAFPSAGWTGYRWYKPYHENNWTSTLEKSGQIMTYETNSHLGYYDAWGGVPCGASAEPVTGSITVNTSVFEWVPNEDYEGPAPKKVLLIDEKGYRRAYDFGVEYCMTALDYVEHDWFKVVSCGSGKNEWAAPAGVVTDTGWEKKNKTNRVDYTYEGVLF